MGINFKVNILMVNHKDMAFILGTQELNLKAYLKMDWEMGMEIGKINKAIDFKELILMIRNAV